jgi:hypothetical protein
MQEVLVMARRHKDLNRAAKVARKLGWTIENHRGHEYWSPPGSKLRIPVASSPSDQNAHKQALRQLRKAGLPV